MRRKNVYDYEHKSDINDVVTHYNSRDMRSVSFQKTFQDLIDILSEASHVKINRVHI